MTPRDPLARRLAEIEARAKLNMETPWEGEVSQFMTAASGEDIPWLVARLRAAMAVIESVSQHSLCTECYKELAAFDALAGEGE